MQQHLTQVKQLDFRKAGEKRIRPAIFYSGSKADKDYRMKEGKELSELEVKTASKVGNNM